MGSETMTLQQLFAENSATELNIAFIALALGFLFVAFFSFRFFKLSLIVFGAATGYSFGSITFGLLLGDSIASFDAAKVIGIALAIVLAILTPKFYKILIYFYGGLLGAVLGFLLSYLVLLTFDLELVGIILGIIFAVLLAVPCAKLLYRLFKPYLIIGTSFIGSSLALGCISLLIFGANELAFEISLLAGLVLGVFAMIAQFKINEDRDLDL